MLGIFIGVAVIGAGAIGVIVDRLPKELRRVEIRDTLSAEIKELLLSTVKHLRHKKQLILIPLTMYSGFEQAFYNAEFSKVVKFVVFGNPLVLCDSFLQPNQTETLVDTSVSSFPPLQSFISCSLGIWMVGLVTIPYGIVNAVVSFISGGIVKYIGRIPVFIAGTVVH